jgi:hypothetical protein
MALRGVKLFWTSFRKFVNSLYSFVFASVRRAADFSVSSSALRLTCPADTDANGLSFMRGALTGPNAIHPDRKTPTERLDEIADILATGLMRLRALRSSPLSRDRGESSLDFSPRAYSANPVLPVISRCITALARKKAEVDPRSWYVAKVPVPAIRDCSS